MKMASHQVKLTQPPKAKYTITDNEDFLVLKIDSEALYKMSHDEKIQAVQWFIKLQKALEQEGAIVIIVRTPIDDPNMKVDLNP